MSISPLRTRATDKDLVGFSSAGLPYNQGVFVNDTPRARQEVVDILSGIHKQGLGFTLTGGYGKGHKSPEHTTYGTAVDLVPTGETSYEALVKALKAAGMNTLVHDAGSGKHIHAYPGESMLKVREEGTKTGAAEEIEGKPKPIEMQKGLPVIEEMKPKEIVPKIITGGVEEKRPLLNPIQRETTGFSPPMPKPIEMTPKELQGQLKPLPQMWNTPQDIPQNTLQNIPQGLPEMQSMPENPLQGLVEGNYNNQITEGTSVMNRFNPANQQNMPMGMPPQTLPPSGGCSAGKMAAGGCSTGATGGGMPGGIGGGMPGGGGSNLGLALVGIGEYLMNKGEKADMSGVQKGMLQNRQQIADFQKMSMANTQEERMLDKKMGFETSQQQQKQSYRQQEIQQARQESMERANQLTQAYKQSGFDIPEGLSDPNAVHEIAKLNTTVQKAKNDDEYRKAVLSLREKEFQHTLNEAQPGAGDLFNDSKDKVLVMMGIKNDPEKYNNLAPEVRQRLDEYLDASIKDASYNYRNELAKQRGKQEGQVTGEYTVEDVERAKTIGKKLYERDDSGAIRPMAGTEEDVERKMAMGKSQQQADNMLSIIDDVLQDEEGIDSSVGGIAGIRGRFAENVQLTDAQRRFKPKLDQLKGSVFMQAYETLKGAGQITEIEGQKAEQALARLDQTQSKEDFVKALGDLKGIVQKAKQRQDKAYRNTEYKEQQREQYLDELDELWGD